MNKVQVVLKGFIGFKGSDVYIRSFFIVIILVFGRKDNFWGWGYRSLILGVFLIILILIIIQDNHAL